ncbi:MAG: TonB C-terminal domain-containing protein [Candidatus Omnitrophica bacterium]|jgi:TonB family protein|nr:TonB C-terminal domain-containing protein [Candidatus Omnitrophota bacterium]
MLTNRILCAAFIISLLAHGFIFLHFPKLSSLPIKQKDQKTEVRYIKEDLEVKPLSKNKSLLDIQKPIYRPDPFLKLDSKVVASRKIPPPYIEQQNKFPKTLSSGFSEFPKPNFSSPDLMIIKKKISLPAIEMAKIDNPSYISYYQIVREKIRRSAYQNYTKDETGEVYVSFIISSDGYIKAVRLVEEKTTARAYLKDIALRSVKDASPFPNFPKELDYPQLSFNIIISFEIE